MLRPQFHLRSLFWLTLVVAVGCMMAPPIWRQAVALIEAHRKPAVVRLFDGDSVWEPDGITSPTDSSSRPE